MLDSVIAEATHDVDVTTNDIEIPMLRSRNVDESTIGSASD